ncbi:Glyoxylase or a related metal-dependent hydrolase, beta-lactamase superfamily II [Geosmithia morbida]|uniref:Glyoxylase or a related metal-dependent hydrolase, beta-lactamase superfamily II n=1 Tax=Geosmithia morbida TaxID=1094350 RepID=A0A9P5D4Y8_9HYPO|nr:Glyoxylase or a related metal-dependent hydrolase, beta-lactamase superfamily II [Geosmithia morbida]KAF4126617.1 Glyoxylase or a related metal-dependent hydrolase, beta-lactamase superfamily II [Geosmithia morbida]
MSFNPPSGAVARVSMIDTASRLHMLRSSWLLKPSVNGLEVMPPLATWSFLIESSTGKKALFDLGMPSGPETCPPSVKAQLEGAGARLESERTVGDVIEQHGISLGDIDSAIWRYAFSPGQEFVNNSTHAHLSHWHWDHVGDVTEFPGTTELVVGPGFMKAFHPGYPRYPDSHIQESYFRDRHVREISFDTDALLIGPVRAHDFFGDGSFYLIDAPGHSTGHMAGLVRTTTTTGCGPDTFILMGADTTHHAGEMRPSASLPIPDTVDYGLDDDEQGAARPRGCCFRQINVRRGRGGDEPFFDAVLADDLDAAAGSIRSAQWADAQENVFYIAAHDMTVEGVVDLFPQTMNDWKSKGWKEVTMWRFLRDLEAATEIR